MNRAQTSALFVLIFALASFVKLQASGAQGQPLSCDLRMATTDFGRNISNATVAGLREDAAVFVPLLRDCWTNLETHETLDQYSFAERAARFKRSLERPDLTVDQGLDLIHDFIASLHDGHLRYSEQRPSETKYSGLRVLETDRGLALIGCESAACAKIDLPAVVELIDGRPAKKWLEGKAELSAGSTRSGRLYSAERSLESYEAAKVSRARADRHATSMTVQSSAGRRISFPIAWTQEMPTWPSNAASLPCVTSKVVDSVFILRIDAFICPLEEVDGVLRPMDAGLVPLLKDAFAKAEPFTKIVIDLRGNTGGLPSAAKWLVSRLRAQPQTFYMRTQKRDSGNPLFNELVDLQPSSDRFDDLFRHAPVWVFADGGCFSQCTILARSLVDSGRARYIGSSIDASAGGPTMWRALSGSWLASIPIWTVQDSKGIAIEGAAPPSSLPFSIPFAQSHKGEHGLRAVLRAIH